MTKPSIIENEEAVEEMDLSGTFFESIHEAIEDVIEELPDETDFGTPLLIGLVRHLGKLAVELEMNKKDLVSLVRVGFDEMRDSYKSMLAEEAENLKNDPNVN